jgi:nitrate reductase molybdenum cofactor assembly chaperone NarJ/NarW
VSARSSWRPVAARAASLLLRYPDAPVLDALPLVTAALAELPGEVAEPLGVVAAHHAGTDPTRLRTEYVELFDFRRRCCLHLTYYTCGDTRKRGEALVGFAAVYKAAGLEVVDGELPDYLPAVLDLAAEATAGEGGWRLLRDNRVGLDLLTESLAKEKSVYRQAVEAVRRMLPPAGRAELAAAARLARTGPPAEQVGLEPYGLVDTTGGRL